MDCEANDISHSGNVTESSSSTSLLPISPDTAATLTDLPNESPSEIHETNTSPDSESRSSHEEASDKNESSFEDSHHTIMTACSIVGEHIRHNITETLNLRGSADDVSQLQAAMIEKLGNFESSVMERLSDSSKSSETTDENSQNRCEVTEVGPLPDAPEELCQKLEDKEMESSNLETSSHCLNPSTCSPLSETAKVPSEASESPALNSDKSISLLQSETSGATELQNDAVCNMLRYQISETVTKTLPSELCQSIMDLVKSSASPDDASSSDLSVSVELIIKEKLQGLKNTLLEKLAGVSCGQDNSTLQQGDAEETSSLSGEADAGEKDCTDENSENSQALQNGDVLDSKTSSTSHKSVSNDKPSKKSQRSGANKKKGEKTIGFFTNQILKSLSSCSSSEEKLNILCRKHAEALDKLKSAEIYQKQNERQVIQLSREKEQLQAEHNRSILAKSRLESLCRELQRQSKAVKEESLLRIREEEEKRKEVASKFQMTLNEISNLMQENSKKNLQLKEENAELAQKLKTLVEHYEMWEKHMEKVVQQKDLEAQLAKAKLAKMNLQLKQETEAFLQEKKTLLENMSELQKKCTQLSSNELMLRAELSDYTSKYEEFQTVLSKSNQVFATFKTDMDTTSKKIRKLEKETHIWKQKCENSNNALIEMIADKQTRDKELMSSQQRILTLEKLCRALQAERNDLQNKVKNQGVEQNSNIPPEEGTAAY